MNTRFVQRMKLSGLRHAIVIRIDPQAQQRPSTT
jgi:hypothetical protein